MVKKKAYKSLPRSKFLETIKKNELKEMTIVFIKKDGTKRIMRCEYGRRVEGSKGLGYDAEAKGLISVFDLDSNGYRMVPIASALKLITKEGSYIVEDK